MRIDIVILTKNSVNIVKQWRVERDAHNIIAVSETDKTTNEILWEEVSSLGQRVEVFLCLKDDILDLNFDYDFIERTLNSAKQCDCEDSLYVVLDIKTRFDKKYKISVKRWFETISKNWGTDVIVVDLNQALIEKELRRSADNSIERMKVLSKLRFQGKWSFILPNENQSLKSLLESPKPLYNTKGVIIVDENTRLPLKWIESQSALYKFHTYLIVILGNLWLDEEIHNIKTYCRQHNMGIIECESLFELRYFLMKLTRSRVFVVMPFQEETNDTYNIIKNCCYGIGLLSIRADDKMGAGYILEEIYHLIEEADIIICDLTLERPNIYYELGYTHGKMVHKSNNILLIAKVDTYIHFDVGSLRIHLYKDKNTLTNVLNQQLNLMVEQL